MAFSELTAVEITKLVSLLCEEIAVLGVRTKSYPEKSAEYQEQIKKNEKLIEKLDSIY